LAAVAIAWLFRPGPALCEWQHFDVLNSGLASNTVYAMAEDHSGNIWFATDKGLSRFDGVVWKTFTTVDGLAGNVISIAEDHSGNLWFVTDGGVSRFDGTNWRTITTADGLAEDVGSVITADHAGNIWLATSRGATRFDGVTWKTFTIDDGLSGVYVFGMAEDPQGNMWFATDGGLKRFDGVSWVAFPAPDNMWSNEIHRFAWDHSGNMWLSGFPPARFDGANWKNFTSADGLATDIAVDITVDRAGNVWFANINGPFFGNGVSRYDGVKFRTYTTADGLAENDASVIMQDHLGNLWFATPFGVSRYDGSSLRTFRKEDGLSGYDVTAIAETRNGTIWAGAWELLHFDGTTWDWLGVTNSYTQHVDINALLEDRFGNLWVGTSFLGAPMLDAAGGLPWSASWGGGLSSQNYLPSDHVTAIAEDRSGNLWFGTDKGVTQYGIEIAPRIFTTADGLPSNSIRAIEADHSGNLWFGTDLGVSRFDGIGFTTPPALAALSQSQITDIAEDRLGNLWFVGSGVLFRFDGTSLRSFTAADGLPPDAVTSVAGDSSTGVWIGTARSGLAHFDGMTWTNYRTDDGLPSDNVTHLFVDHDGSVWFSTFTISYNTSDRANDLTRFEPDHTAPRAVFLNALPAVSGSRTLAANFVAAYGETKGIQFSDRFDGGSWTDWAPVGSWSLAGISDGTHTLEIRCRDKSNNVDPAPTKAVFEVDATPPSPVISSPAYGQAVRGSVELSGTAADARFLQFQVEARPAGASSWNPPEATRVEISATPVTQGHVATWDTSSLPDGDYELRLSVTDSLGLTGTAQVTVVVDNHAPYADVTAPARVPAATGGDIFTTNSELHLYFPPHAFQEDAVVTVAAVSAPDALPTGAVQVEPAYDVSWSPSTLQKPATLEFSTAGRAPAPGTLAIYVLPEGGSWQRLGGTAEQGKVSLAIQSPGRYALVAETAPVQGTGLLSPISFTPRVFSVSNHFANDQVAIGFSLGRSAPVTVRIYNRAGRLVRDVLEGQMMGAGANLVRWNGVDRADVPVADGIYLVTVEALGETRKSTIAVVK